METLGTEQNPQTHPRESEEALARKRKTFENMLQLKYAMICAAKQDNSVSEASVDDTRVLSQLSGISNGFRNWFNTMTESDAKTVQQYLETHSLDEIQSMQDMDEILEVFKNSLALH